VGCDLEENVVCFGGVRGTRDDRVGGTWTEAFGIVNALSTISASLEVCSNPSRTLD
jgi:hypothetical protein